MKQFAQGQTGSQAAHRLRREVERSEIGAAACVEAVTAVTADKELTTRNFRRNFRRCDQQEILRMIGDAGRRAARGQQRKKDKLRRLSQLACKLRGHPERKLRMPLAFGAPYGRA